MATTRVKGHYRNGKYVRPHNRHVSESTMASDDKRKVILIVQKLEKENPTYGAKLSEVKQRARLKDVTNPTQTIEQMLREGSIYQPSSTSLRIL